MRLMRLQSFICRFARGLSGYPQRLLGTRFRLPIRPLRTGRPLTRQDQVHSLVSASPLRSLSAAPSGRLLRGGTTLPGSLPSSRLHRWCPHTRKLPLPLRSVLGLSQPLDGLLHHSALRAYCIPLPRAGFLSVQGLLPIRSRPWLITSPLPPCRYRLCAHRQAGCHTKTPRLRGFAPRIDAFLRSGR